ncbi:tripartite tricarboxylate transporter substrate-binding protein [Roseococcus sp. DSY-14]|uniref:tripartite tricarboxylate transporter substrate-binding protein n=1 Tax=Roseococcus sp. DSY-14 TaxID=3369650 RepID=UPI00387B7CE6
MHRRTLLAATLALPAVARAQSGTQSGAPLRLVVPFAPGGTSDILARLLQGPLAAELGQPVVVENRSGANGNLGAELVARAAGDGTALLLTDAGALATAPALFPRLPFDALRDLRPVQMLGYSPYLLVVNPAVPAADARALEALARRSPDSINIATSGVGAANHLVPLLLAKHWGVTLTTVPYRGGAAALTAVAGGEAQVLVNGAAATLPFARDGRLRAVATSRAGSRLPALPDVPTFDELGWPAGGSGTFQGILAPAATPPETVARLSAALDRAHLADPVIARRYDQLATERSSMGPAAFAAWLAREAEQWGRVVRENRITAE